MTLYDDSDGVRRAAANALNRLDQPGATDALLDTLTDDDPTVRKAAAEALGFLRNRATIKPLADVALFDEDESVRRAAAEALNEFHRDIYQDPALEHLLDALASNDARVRKAAAEALGFLGNRAAVGPLLDVALYDDDDSVRRAAADALNEIYPDGALDYLLDALTDEDPATRSAAAQALGFLGNRAALHPLADLALNDGDETVRQTAAEALGELDRGRAAEILIQALADEEADSREAASEALEDIGASLTTLENGTSLVTDGNLGYWVPGTTTAQSPGLPRNPVFEVRGAAHTDYLRTATGDVYENGKWRQLDPVDLRYTPPADLPSLVASAVDTPGGPFSSLTPLRIDHALLAQFTTAPTERHTVVIHITPLGSLTAIPAGPAPTSLHLQSASLPGTLRPYSSTLSFERPVPGYSWTSRVAVYSQQQLARATVSPDPTYTQLPDDLPDRIRDLAIDITGGLPGPYAKARAIETYLRIRYPYRFADSEDDLVPPGRDPVDWFLFDHQEGTCGVFSSAFVVLARSVGLPARVVSGWAIAQTAGAQTVYTNQGHQWAEVAFDGLGWVSFEPTGGAGGPSSRVALSGDANSQAGDLDDTGVQVTGPGDASSTTAGPGDDGTLQALVEALTAPDELTQQLASKALEDIGASLTTLENGTSLVTNRNQGYWVPRTTTAQSPGLPHNPVFEVRGAANTAYLRTATGDVYENGQWRQLDPVDLRYNPPADLPGLVASAIDTPGGPFSSLAPRRIDHALLAQFTTAPAEQHTDVIHITPLGSLTAIPAGPAPTSLHLQSASLPGTFHPYSSTLSIESPVPGYSWTSRVAVYSQHQLARATVSPDPTYTQLPDDLPDRIRNLATNITSGLPGPYAKARAIETYLRIRYSYRFADSEDDLVPPGRDPVDWFLFDHQEGTCGVYSSAFVVLARSVGLPARVVSGWAIAQTAGTQTVYTNQGHQWAEVAFDGLGWISFEPTGSGGPVDRLTADGPLQHSEGERVTADDPPHPSEPASGPRDTVSEITLSPQQARKGFPFEIGGTVYTTSGAPVDGMEVEIFINEEKVNGGVKIGSGITEDGRFEIEILVPTEFEGGSYQLIAHAIANSNFNESWSDPEISIYSGSEFELTGPTELPVDTEAVFRGKLFEETGRPLAGREIRVSIDGQRTLAVVTNDVGSFEFSTTFSQPGRHQIEVDFGRDEFLLGNSARLAIDVTLPTRLAIDAPGQVAVGREFTLTGRLRDVRGEPLSEESIDLSIGGSTIEQVQTDSEGNFSAAHSITAGPGEYVIVAEFTGEGAVLGSTDRVKVTAATATVTAEDPEPVARGHTVTLRGVVTVGGELAPGEDIALDGVQFGRTSAAGDFVIQYPVPFDAELGIKELEVSVPGLGISTTIAVQIDALSEMEMDAPSQVEVGREFAIEGTLRNFRGEPLGGRNVKVKVGDAAVQTARTDPEGNFRITHALVAPGEYEISGEFSGDGPVRPSAALARVTAWFGTALTLEGPVRIGIGQEGTFSGRLTSSIGSHVGATAVMIEDPEGNLLTTVTPDESGAFQFRRSFSESGPITLTASLPSSSAWSASKSSLTVEVVSPTNLTIHSGKTALLGEPHTVRGALTGPNGEPISGEPVAIRIAGRHWETLDTGDDGTFTFTTAFGREAETAISAEFRGTEHLASSQASLRVTVGIPSLVVETPDPATRGGMAILRGSVVIGSELVPEVELTVNGESYGHSSRVGSFVIRYPIPGDHKLGTAEIELAAPALGAASVVPVQVMSATSLIVVPTGKVKLGDRLVLEATLLDDQGQGISNATLRIGSEVTSTTGPGGTAMFEMEAPAEPGLSAIPVTVVFDGDDNHLPVSYTAGIPVTPEDFNWLLWVVVPLLVAGGVGAYWSGRRGMVPSAAPETTAGRPWYARAIPSAGKGRSPTAPKEREGDEKGEAEPAEPVKEPVSTHLSIEFRSDVEDLPDVWGVNEEIEVICTLRDQQERSVECASVEVTTSESAAPEHLRTGDEGSCTASTPAVSLGVHRVSAEFGGDDDHLPAVARREYRIVDFREEVVRIYNDFLQWVCRRVPGASDRSTPREIEVMVVASGLQIDQRALEEIISRFEEADYSEHVITRRQYEATYRAWRSAIGGQAGR